MRTQRGVTLIELIVIVGILTLLAALLVRSFQGVRHAARVVECGHNLREVWLSLSGYAQDNDFKLPPGDTNPDRLPAASAEAFRELLEGRLEALYCRTYPLRREKLGEWEDAIARGGTWHSPCIGYLYLAGSRYDGWDVPNDNLPEGFPGANRIGSVGNDLSGTAEVVWMADFARRTTNNPADRQRPLTWDLTSHPPQRVKGKDERIGREDYRLPDGANVLFKDGHVVFRPFADLRPRLIKSGRVFYW